MASQAAAPEIGLSPQAFERWVVVGPRGGDGCRLLLARAGRPEQLEQLEQVGRQAGGRVALLLETDDLGRDYELYRSGGGRGGRTSLYLPTQSKLASLFIKREKTHKA